MLLLQYVFLFVKDRVLPLMVSLFKIYFLSVLGHLQWVNQDQFLSFCLSFFFFFLSQCLVAASRVEPQNLLSTILIVLHVQILFTKMDYFLMTRFWKVDSVTSFNHYMIDNTLLAQFQMVSYFQVHVFFKSSFRS